MQNLVDIIKLLIFAPVKQNAEIAQLVEHNLAKVRVASSSLVFRSCFFEMMELSFAQVAELVDAHVSGACVERHAGSSPVLGTSKRMTYMVVRFFYIPL